VGKHLFAHLGPVEDLGVRDLPLGIPEERHDGVRGQAVGSLTLGRLRRGVRRFIRQQGMSPGPVTLTECAIPGKGRSPSQS
jgi:hypothetical protein